MFKQIGDKCYALKPFPTEAILAEQSALVKKPQKESVASQSMPKKSNVTYNLNADSENQFSSPNVIIDTEDIKPSKQPLFTSKNDVLSTQEDSPLMQAVMKVPTLEPAKQQPASQRKDNDPNELIRVDEMTANLHANDQPIYRVVTQPTVDKKSNKKGSLVKETNGNKSHKNGHQKKSPVKGNVLEYVLMYT